MSGEGQKKIEAWFANVKSNVIWTTVLNLLVVVIASGILIYRLQQLSETLTTTTTELRNVSENVKRYVGKTDSLQADMLVFRQHMAAVDTTINK